MKNHQMTERRKNMPHRNAVARAHLLRGASYYQKGLGTFTTGGSLSGNTRIKLFNTGLMTGVLLRVTMNYTVGTATATLSGKGPHAAISRIKLVDFDGSDRINVSGYHLWLRNTMRYRRPFGVANEGTGPVIAEPNVPTGVGAQSATFFVYVPVCANIWRKDLRGMMLMQTAVGEIYLSIDWASALYGNANDDNVFNGAATSTVSAVSFSVEAWQELFMPQAGPHGNVQLPELDLLQVYELSGTIRTTTDFAANTEKLVSLPNVREVLGGIYSYRVSNQFPANAANDIIKHRLIANGNTVLREDSDQSFYFRQRMRYNGDVSPYPAGTLANAKLGTYLFDFKEQPIQTWLYGNVQQGFTPAGSSSTDLETTFESIYKKGTVLPGLGQGQ